MSRPSESRNMVATNAIVMAEDNCCDIPPDSLPRNQSIDQPRVPGAVVVDASIPDPPA